MFHERRARVYFRVLVGTALLADTDETVTWWIKGTDGITLILVVQSTPIATGLTLAAFVVRGHLYDALEGRPLDDTTVKAIDRNVRSETVLGTTTTDGRGSYTIQYTAASITHPGKMRADLLVRAVDSLGATIAEAPVRCHAPPTSVIDLVANGTTYRGRSEHDDVKERIQDAAGAVDVGTLTAEEIEQVACSVQLDVALVAAYSNAVRLETEVGFPETGLIFYGLLRQGLPADRRKLLMTPPAQLRRALEKSIEDNILGPVENPEQLDQAMDFLRERTVDLAFETPHEGTTANFGHVIGLALSGESDPTAAARTFVDRYTAHEGTIEEFWESLETELSAPTIARLQLSLQWGAVTRHHKPLMARLEALRAASTVTTLKDLARYDEDDWLDIIDYVQVGTEDPPIGYPADVPGATAAEKRTNYAKILTDALETAFPTVAIHDRVFRTEGNGTDLWKFLQNNGGFEFGKTRVNLFMADSPDLTGVGDTNELKTRLQRMERVFKLTPKYVEMKRLLDDGRHSAQSIERMGKERFAAKYTEHFGACRTEAIFERACYVSAAATHLYQKYSAAMNPVGYSVLPNKTLKYELAAATPEVADWEELFGSLDFCACERCRSLHGPAAYLVDLLQFLDKQYVNLTETAKDVLLAIRPDIARIELSCDNTNIALPQVDLNIELMERAIAGALPAPPTVIKTTGTTEELLAMPEVIDDGAKTEAATALAAAVFPWALPFSMPGEEARVYLDHLGVPRWRLMEALQSATETPMLSDNEIAYEHLGMSRTERMLVLGEALVPATTTQDHWGLSAGTWDDDLARVDTFLKQSGLSYDELRELVDSAFLDELGTPALTPDEGSDGCDLSKVSITGLDTPLEATWEKVHRFLRLRRRLGWTITEVDQAVQALDTADEPDPAIIDAALLRSLSELLRVREHVRVPLPEMLSWWADIDSRVRPETNKPSLYERLFLNKAVQSPVDAAFSPAPSGGGALSDHKKPILAALQLSEADFQLLTVVSETNREVTLPRPLPNDNFTLANLSCLHRVASLARTLKLSVREVLILRALTGDEPLAGLSPAGTGTAGPASARTFVERVQKLRAAGWRAAELHYLLRHVTQPSEGVNPEDALRARRRGELEAELTKIADANVFVSDPTGKALETLLTELLTVTMENASPGDLQHAANQVLDLIKGVPIEDPEDPPNPLSNSDRLDMLVDYLDKLIDEADLTLAMIVPPAAPLPEPLPNPDVDFVLEVTRIDFIHARLLDFVRNRDCDGIIKQNLSQWFALDGSSVDALLQKLTIPGPDPAPDTTNVLVELRLPIGDGVRRGEALLRFTKAAMVVTRLGLGANQLAWILGESAEDGWLDFNALPLVAALPGDPLTDARTQLVGLERLMDLVDLAGRLKGGPTTLFDLLRFTVTNAAPGNVGIFQEELAARTGWRLEDIESLATRFGLTTYPEHYRSEIALRRLADVFDLQKRVGATPTGSLVDWTAIDVTAAVAAEIRLVAKAKYAPEDWLTVARPLRDVLREKQRASLVAYLVNQDNLDGPDGLMGKLLVDVQMTCCQLTSRIKHAIGSVQLFVQRAFLNLLPTVKLKQRAAQEWAWMKTFVVWEAARKVFLYPENWIEPELRDGKTPFFKQLESQLMQNEITDENCEQAYLAYLDKLDEVARLNVVGMCKHQEPSDQAIDVLHVFGRTEGLPHSYFHRTRVDSSYWTPWTKIDLEIPGDHVLAAVVDRRLHLYWPIFEDVADEVQDPPNDAAPPKPRIHLEIKMAATHLRGERWLAPRTTDGPAAKYNEGGHSAVKRELLMLGFEPGQLYSIVVGNLDFPNAKVAARFQSRGCRGELARWPSGSATLIHDGPWNMGFYYDDHFTIDNQLWMWVNPQGIPFNGRLLAAIPQPWSIKTPHVWRLPGDPEAGPETEQFFLKDKTRTFFVHLEPFTTVTYTQSSSSRPNQSAPRGECSAAGLWSAATSIWIKNEHTERKYVFDTFYHPYVCRFLKELSRYGLDGLRQWSKFSPRLQLENSDFFDDYEPTPSLVATDPPYRPMDDVDFSFRGAYSAYNWELFFQIPFMIAIRLTKNQRFAEAQKWFHAIFNPTDGSSEDSPQRFWKVRPFYENKSLASIQQEMLNLAELAQNKDSLEQWFLLHPPNDEASLAASEIIDQIKAWRKQPFNPHLLARMRPIAYQKATVMRYLDNLIAWGDQLFRRDTIESINEASQLYILAQTILGDRPREVPTRNVAPKTYAALEADLDEFSNALESLVPIGQPGSQFDELNGKLVLCEENQPTPMVHTLYFCVPQNEKLLGYWDTVADRLFKIRNCMNIEGVVRELPLFEPPVDPALLVAAAAAGVDIGDVLNDLAGPPPVYRFQVLHAKAMELCGSVAGLAGSLLSALEKRDAEELSLLRSGQEIELLTMVRDVRRDQVNEASENIKALELSRKITEERRDYYRDIEYMNAAETEAELLMTLAASFGGISQGAQAGAAIAHFFPDQYVGTAGMAASPVAVTLVGGGSKAGSAMEAGAKVLDFVASVLRDNASMAVTTGGYERRWEEWKLQERLAEGELKQIDKQIAASRIRLEIAKKELTNHERQIENARQVEDYLKSKYTNQDLYAWMVEQTSVVYFQSYQLAYDMAKRAEKAWQFERGEPSTKFLKFGYWDSLKKGLMSSEKLQYDLRRMESAYLAQNKREYEITKHVSLAEMFPEALLKLRAGLSAEIDLTEAHFDLDYPGHYMRRIKSLSMTVAAVTGPYTGVNCTLTQLKSVIRKDKSAAGDYPLDANGGDSRALYNFAPIQSICTSSGQNDAGLFELNFRDERFLPFEGAGAVGRFRIEMPADHNRFDLETLTDVVLHVRYMAREGGALLKATAAAALGEAPSNEWQPLSAFRLFSAKRDFPKEWKRFLTTVEGVANDQVLHLPMTAERLPFLPGSLPLTITNVRLAASWNDDEDWPTNMGLTNAKVVPATDPFAVPNAPALAAPTPEVPTVYPAPPGEWLLTITQAELEALEALEDSEDLAGLRTEQLTTPTEHLRLRATAIDDIYILVVVERTAPPSP